MNISLKHVSFSYNNIKVLQDISLDIKLGEIVAIIGPNGVGKTTLAKHLNGLLKPTKGIVMIDNIDTNKINVAKLSSKVGYIFQNPDEQIFKRTVYDEVAFGPKNLGYSAFKVKELVYNALYKVKLDQYIKSHPYDLTWSQRKLVAIASVLAMDTPIIIMDEPTLGQDFRGKQLINSIIDDLSLRRKTIITITHDIDFCINNFNRLIVMKEGKIILDGPKEFVFSQEDLLFNCNVKAPYTTILAKRLGFSKIIVEENQFISYLKEWRKINKNKVNNETKN
jgi:energy-coupling factor transport system ATP-binding protein